jgi:hypothetical protein
MKAVAISSYLQCWICELEGHENVHVATVKDKMHNDSYVHVNGTVAHIHICREQRKAPNGCLFNDSFLEADDSVE